MAVNNVRGGYCAVQKAAAGAGALFLLVGILGFIPGITTHYDRLSWAGHESGAALLGIFQVSVLHNVIHLAFGVAGLLMARSFSAARSYLVGGGLIYAVVWLYGVLVDQTSPANIIPLNTADNWLHFVLALAMVGLGVGMGRHDATRTAAQDTAVPRTAR